MIVPMTGITDPAAAPIVIAAADPPAIVPTTEAIAVSNPVPTFLTNYLVVSVLS